jgi:DNA repair exonuclease SbcCD ATPase subunit
MSKIIRLQSENFKRLHAVDITPQDNVVIISGKNANGKSSVLDSISAALCGKSAVPERPVRTGAKRAETIVETDDLIVTRSYTASGGSTLTVQGKDGTRFPSPQAVLDKLVGNLAFDPQAFSRMEPKKQADAVRALVKLDFTSLEQRKKAAFEKRTSVNRDAKAIQARIDAIPRDVGAPTAEVDPSQLTAEVTERQRINAENQAFRTRLETTEAELNNATARNRQLRDQIAELQKQQASVYEDVVFLTEKIKDMREKAAALVDLDVQEPLRKINECAALNARFQKARQREALVLAVQSADGESDKLSAEIDAIEEEKRQSLESAQFPIAGLSFDETGVIYQGQPFDQASTAEKIKVSMAMALAMNPALRVVLIRDGSTLDADSMKVVEEMARERDAQIWVERVADGEKVGIVIEDGSVAE